MGGPRTVVGVRVTNEGTDRGSLTPMLDQIEQRTGQTPEVIIADGGHEHHACICNLVGRGVLPLVSPRERTKTRDYNDEPAVDAWRHIMQTPEAKQLYRPGRSASCRTHIQNPIRAHALSGARTRQGDERRAADDRRFDPVGSWRCVARVAIWLR